MKNKNKKPKAWLLGMIAGQVAGFTAALLLAPPALIVPALLVSTLVGGFLGSFAGGKVDRRRLSARFAPPSMRLRESVFQALVDTDSKLGEIFIEEEFNSVAANNNEPAQEKKHTLENKPALAAVPQMKPF